jgi:hypothetical protein
MIATVARQSLLLVPLVLTNGLPNCAAGLYDGALSDEQILEVASASK